MPSRARRLKEQARAKAQSKKADPKTTGTHDAGVGKPAPSPAKGNKASRTREKSVGLKDHPVNKRIPGAAIIRRQTAEPFAGVEPSPQPRVIGDQSLVVIDTAQKRPVSVFLIGAKSLDPKADGRLVFVQGAVSNGLMTAENARSKFAVEPNGTVVYASRGFDDVPHAKFDLVDIAVLIEHANKRK